MRTVALQEIGHKKGSPKVMNSSNSETWQTSSSAHPSLHTQMTKAVNTVQVKSILEMQLAECLGI